MATGQLQGDVDDLPGAGMPGRGSSMPSRHRRDAAREELIAPGEPIDVLDDKTEPRLPR